LKIEELLGFGEGFVADVDVLAFEEVVVNLQRGGLNTALEALARFAADQLVEPIKCCVVDGLRQVEPEIEAAVVCSAEGQNEFVLFLLGFVDDQLGDPFLEQVGADEGGLVAEELPAAAEVFWEQFRDFPFEEGAHVAPYAIPKLAFAFVEVVDGGEVKVFLVPAEEGLPLPHVAVGAVHALDGVAQAVPEDRVQLFQVPCSRARLHQRIEQVGAVERGRERYVFPELC
jgi:hypothetical protein